jgi:hypothetical protein
MDREVISRLPVIGPDRGRVESAVSLETPVADPAFRWRTQHPGPLCGDHE